MKSRFEGDTGRPLLLESLKKQDVIEHKEELAIFLAERGELVDFTPGQDVVVQDATDNDVYFILSGEANVFVNECFVASREEGACIGEMAAIDPAATRSATVRARTELVAFKVTEPVFRQTAELHPLIYKSLALVLSQRLRQRSTFHQPPNPVPVLFIGCSVEALPIAREVQAGLMHDQIVARAWADGVFGPSSVTVDTLLQAAEEADFAAFVLAPDDKVLSREEEMLAPRDNVIFELGLFMGRLDRRRVFLILAHGSDVKIPSDLLGITPISYRIKGDDLASAMAPPCHEIRKIVGKLGVR